MSKKILIVIAVFVPLILIIFAGLFPREWEGVDVAVVETKAEELGGKVHKPLINLEGDALLFAFAVAGAAGGFVLGYFWRNLFEPQANHRRSDTSAKRES